MAPNQPSAEAPFPSVPVALSTRQRRTQSLPGWLRLSWSWRITWVYLILVLFLPLGAMALKALAVGPGEFFHLPPPQRPSPPTG